MNTENCHAFLAGQMIRYSLKKTIKKNTLIGNFDKILKIR